jgi:processive 1,2-diacylglycerol beta-glucosyltransferase
VHGWTDDMPALMAAADVLVENAGGLTCMEAFAAGLPVLTYRPIAGHGRGNAAEMEAAGVAAWAQPGGLRAALDETAGIGGARRRVAARAMFAGDAAHDVAVLAGEGAPAPAVAPPRPRWPRRVAGVAVGVVAALAGAVALTSIGAGIAAAHGVAVAHPPAHAVDAYVALRIGQAATDDPRVAPALAGAHVTAIVCGSMAAADPLGVWELSAAGVDVANGGWGTHRGLTWNWRADVQRSGDAIRDATGVRVRTFAPGGRIDGLSLVSASWNNQRVVLARTLLPSAPLPSVEPGGVYVLDTRSLGPDQVLALISQIEALEAGGRSVAPLSALAG